MVQKSQGKKSKDVTFYSNHVKWLFEAKNENAYTKMLTKFRAKWDPAFEEYYMSHIHRDISSIGRWSFNIYCPHSGITNNQSESLNRYVLMACFNYNMLVNCICHTQSLQRISELARSYH